MVLFQDGLCLSVNTTKGLLHHTSTSIAADWTSTMFPSSQNNCLCSIGQKCTKINLHHEWFSWILKNIWIQFVNAVVTFIQCLILPNPSPRFLLVQSPEGVTTEATRIYYLYRWFQNPLIQIIWCIQCFLFINTMMK